MVSSTATSGSVPVRGIVSPAGRISPPGLIDLAVIGGDGIGPEVIAEALKVLRAALPGTVTLETTEYDLGARHWHATGETLPDERWSELREPRRDPARRGRRPDRARPACWSGGCCSSCASPSTTTSTCGRRKLYPGVVGPLRSDPAPIDFVVVREGTEGPYVGNGGSLRTGTPHEIATEVCVNTAFGVERVVRDAFDPRRRPAAQEAHARAQEQRAGPRRAPVEADRRRGGQPSSPRSPPTTCTWTRPRSSWSPQPERFDVIVTDNLFGDILTDLAAAVTGGIGLAASGNINPDGHRSRRCSSPCTARAPDIAGQRQGRPDRRHPVRRAAAATTSATPAEAAPESSRARRRRPRRGGPGRAAEYGRAARAR